MSVDLARELAHHLEAKEYRAAKTLVNEGGTEPLAKIWPRLPLFERLIVFKLLSPERAWDLFKRLDFEDCYTLFTAFDLEAIAPVLEPLSDEDRGLFEVLPQSYYLKMAEALKS